MYVLGAAVSDESATLPVHQAADGSYRLRIHVKNRDAGEDRNEGDPEEIHLLQIWSAPEAAPTLLKATDQVGTYWRSQQG